MFTVFPVLPRRINLSRRLAAIPLLCLFCLLLHSVATARPIRVPQEYGMIQEAINYSSEGDEIWVSRGTYSESITMRSQVSVYGGFVGTETRRDQRDESGKYTIIDGSTADWGRKPVSHVVTMNSITGSCLDGFTITGGKAVSSTGGGVYCSGLDQTCAIRNCIVVRNSSTSSGGGIGLSDCTNLAITGCSVLANSASRYGGGIFGSYSRVTVSGCSFVGNSASWGQGAAIYLDDVAEGSKLQSCTIVANDGGGLYVYGYGWIPVPTTEISHCIVSGNRGSDAIGTWNGVNLIRNCLVSGNSGNAAYGNLDIQNSTISDNAGDGASSWRSTISNSIVSGCSVGIYGGVTISHCLFHGNATDYRNYPYPDLQGATTLTMNLPGAVANRGGDPLFVNGPNGVWTEAPVYDPIAVRTDLRDGAASFTPGALVGKLINPNATQGLQSIIVSNTTDTIIVAGDVSTAAAAGSAYQVIDYHLQNGSAALNGGDASLAPADDLEGRTRAGADGVVDIGAYEADDSFMPLPDTTKPESRAKALAAITTSSLVSVAYAAADGETTVALVRLYYRKEGGSWQQYGDGFTTNPIAFDSTQTGGDGFYDFYTGATDSAGNVEDAHTAADAHTEVVSHYEGDRVYVSGTATGPETGRTWANAYRTFRPAIQIASAFSVPEIWVAEGTYSESVVMASRISIYGGFAGTETARDQRNATLHPTVIDGSKANSGQPAVHVVVMDSITSARLDGFTVTGASAATNDYSAPDSQRSGGGVYCNKLDRSSSISNCTIRGNSVENYGGGIYLTTCTAVSITGCTISRNTSGDYGGGIAARYSSARVIGCLIADNVSSWGTSGAHLPGSSLKNCTITANIGGSSYGAVYLFGSQIDNCVLVGNRQYGGGLLSSATMTNCIVSGNARFGVRAYLSNIRSCTISDNKDKDDNYGPYSGYGVDAWSSASIANCILTGNNVGIDHDSYGEGLAISHCLFGDNKIDLKLNYSSRFTDPTSIGLNVAGADHILGGAPLFTNGTTGTWTSAPIYDPTVSQTRLRDASGPFAPGSLAGKFVNPNTTQVLQSVIVSNTTDTVVVVGDCTAATTRGLTYQIIDYHLRNGSAALDGGDAAMAPPDDLDGNPRPGSDGLVDIGAYEAIGAFVPPPDHKKPISFVAPLNEVTTTSMVSVAYRATDGETDVKQVELVYRRNGGPWRTYGSRFTTSPVAFDTAQTGGDGLYEFRSRATDMAGNVEDAHTTTDAQTSVITHFSGSRIYVDRRATGQETGESWTSACRSIPAALQLASAFSIGEIWVAEGIYAESNDAPPYPYPWVGGQYLRLISNIGVYGGFSGTEASLAERDLAAHPTFLRDGETEPYSASTPLLEGVKNCRLDGFVSECEYNAFTCYLADQTNVIANCIIRNNPHTDGMWCTTSSLTIENCTIQGNASGGLSCVASSPTIRNCTIQGNATWGGDTGGIDCADSSPTIVNSLIAGNGTSGIHAMRSAITVTNSTIADNFYDYLEYQQAPVAGISATRSTVTARNTIFHGNSDSGISLTSSTVSLAYCDFQGNRLQDILLCDDGTPLTGIYTIGLGINGAVGTVDSDPLFVMDTEDATTRTFSSAVYNQATGCTTLSGTTPTLGPVVGRAVLFPNWNGSSVITSQTATGIIVLGDFSGRWISSYTIADYGLTAFSHCIDAGGAVPGLSDDILGAPRPHDAGAKNRGDGSLFDIGAYEYSFRVGPSRQPAQPVNISPTTTTTPIAGDVTLVASSFSDPDAGDKHAMSQWQVIEDGRAPRLLFDSGRDSISKTRITIPAASLAAAIHTCQWMVRYRDDNMTWSDWSTGTHFSTIIPRTIRVPKDYGTIQAAIDAAPAGSEVIVSPGTYRENILFRGKDLVLRSTDPASSSVVAATIIDGHKSGTVVTFAGTETAACRLSGFTITNGAPINYGTSRAGIAGGEMSYYYDTSYTWATIENNVLTANAGYVVGSCDGLIRNNVFTENNGEGVLNSCSGVIENNVISKNTGSALSWCDGTIQGNSIVSNRVLSAPYTIRGTILYCPATIRYNLIQGNHSDYSGGGVSNCWGTIEGNTIIGNTAGPNGGGLYGCGGVIRGNLIASNAVLSTVTYAMGGGLADCHGLIESNIIRYNSAPTGGGLASCIRSHSGLQSIRNNLIVANYSTREGGGLYACGYTGDAKSTSTAIQNNTIFGNKSDGLAGGLSQCNGDIANNIIYANHAPVNAQINACSAPMSCCIEGWQSFANGNVLSSPRFVNANKGDFHLREDSPLIDAGMKIADLTSDLEGRARGIRGYSYPRGDGSQFDIGAYEFAPPEIVGTSKYDGDYIVPGRPVYADRDYVFVVVPTPCSGCYYLKMRNDEKDVVATNFLTLQLKVASTVYIALDLRTDPRPSWMANWQKCSERITTTDGAPVRVLYKKHFAAGSVVLGSNRDAGQPTGRSMYTVILVPDPGPRPTGTENWQRYQ